MAAAPKDARAIFLTALDLLLPTERAAYLEQACAGDGALRQRVEALLRAHDEPGAFLSEANPDPNATQAAAPSLVGTVVVGRYKLLEEIGDGGMGTVWMAEQREPVKRLVAVKLIKAGMDSKAVLARFEAERQALALMDHPNIAKVLDGGTTSGEAGGVSPGRPFFVMELVKGLPLTEYCDARRLPVRDRLDLFVQICSAIQHAHQKAVIHRDLKPSNVLVTEHDGKPVPKVIDFGLAKALNATNMLTDRTLHTAFGTVVGTPLYMAPEQVGINALDVDTRTDIYALGVILYELLAGSTPFEKARFKEAAWDEVKRLIREEDPPRPSTRLSSSASLPTLAASRQVEPAQLSRLVRGELDWIVMKALEKDRSRRYETANGLAADIHRYLNGEPVLAHPPSRTYRVKKFIRRHRPQVIAVSLVLFALIAGIAGTTWGLIEANSQRDRAEQEQQAAMHERDEKEKARQAEADRAEGERLAKKQAQQRLGQIQKANDLLGSIFESLDPKEVAKETRPLQAMLVEKLDMAVEQLEGDAVGDPLLVAALQDKLGVSLIGLGEPKKAIVVLKKARATRQEKLGPDDPDTLATMYNLAVSYADAGQTELALALHKETLKLRQARLGADHPATLNSMNSLADGYLAAGELKLALPLYEETLKLRQAKLGPKDRQTLISMVRLGWAYHAAGKYDLAPAMFDETLKLRKATLGPTHPDTMSSMYALAVAYEAAGKQDLALPLFEETVKLMKARFGPDHPETLAGMEGLAQGYLAAGKWDQSLQLFEEVMHLTKAKSGPDHPSTLISMNNLANAYGVTGNGELALPLAEETVKLMRAKLDTDHPTTLTGMGVLASSYLQAGKAGLAVQLHEEVLKCRKAKLGPDHPGTLVSMHNLALAYYTLGQWDRSLAMIQETVKLSTAKLGDDHPETLTTLHNLVSHYRDTGKLVLALTLGEKTLKVYQAKLGADHPHTLRMMACLAWTYHRAGMRDHALSLSKATLELRMAKLGPEHPHTLESLKNLATVYQDAGDLEAAEPLFAQFHAAQLKQMIARLQRYHKDRVQKLGAEHADCLDALHRLAQAYRDADKFPEAIKIFEQLKGTRTKGLGADHVTTLGCLNQLGVTYWRAKQFDKSVPIFEELLKRWEAKNGRQDQATQQAVANLGVNYRDAGKFAEGIPLLEEAYASSRKLPSLRWVETELLAGYFAAGESAKATKLVLDKLPEVRKTVPKESPALAQALAHYSLTLLQGKAYTEAEPLLRECLSIREKHLPEAWSTYNAKSMLGAALLGQKKYTEAEPLLLVGYEGMRQRAKLIPTEGKVRLFEAVERLVQLYDATGRKEEAAKWRKKLEAGKTK
jgi:serine/threonine protein kinase